VSILKPVDIRNMTVMPEWNLEDLTEMTIKITVLSDVTPCNIFIYYLFTDIGIGTAESV
jgi:hypothetical protein